jgi:glutamate-1-semialdehyde 2,1-aminomutase
MDTADGIALEESRLLQLARRHIAGGVVSLNRKVEPVRTFKRAKGSKLWDVQDREYIDFHAAFSPFLLGHCFDAVDSAVRAALDREWSLIGSGATPWEVRLAQLLCESVASLDLVQITNTGSEATSLAIRLSRAYTGRDDVLLMLGGYNGWQDDVARVVMPSLGQVGPRRHPGEYPFLPASAGIPESAQRRIHVANFNDLESVEYILAKHDIACVLTEPVLQNIGVVLPRPGYLAQLIELCRKHGALCVFDEVKTGFRSALGGYQSVAGVSPDLSVFGKSVANGYPLGVIGGRREIMERFDDPDPARRVLIAGTYNAHPINCAASIATLEFLRRPGIYESIRAQSQRLYRGLAELFAERGVAMSLVANESAFCAYFCEAAPRDLHDILGSHDFELDRRYRAGLIARGIYHIPIPCKQGSIGYSHSAADIDRTLEITREVLAGI